MPFPIEDKLVVAVASSALFKLDEADHIFREKGISAYREYQRKHESEVLGQGIAFPFVRRLLEINRLFPDTQPVEVVLLSRNDPDTGMRVFHSINHYELDISRAAFTGGDSAFRYIPAYNVSLFLSANENDVREAISNEYAAGLVLESLALDDRDDPGLRIAFDFDGVIADDSSEKVFADKGLTQYLRSEDEKAEIPLSPGPLAVLFRKLGNLRKLEDERIEKDPAYKRYLKTSIVTARNAPAHKRVVTTLREWNINVDEAFFLGGMNKGRILSTLRPHIFFDDQRDPHLNAAKDFTPSVHIPFGFASDGAHRKHEKSGAGS